MTVLHRCLIAHRSALHRTLNDRQLGLKLVANVTYGYTSASFSGRMPNAHLADAIVQTGRETLEAAIEMVHQRREWRARVVYGDTDSMFVLLEGRSVAEAFAVGRAIAEAVTERCPHPMELELEKVYAASMLQAKKRYVGLSYESARQYEQHVAGDASRAPALDVKGLEAVRRDACLATVKVMDRALRLLLTTKDVSAVKSYVLRQCDKLWTGRFPLIDCVFATEMKGGAQDTFGYKSEGVAPGSGQAATTRLRAVSGDVISG